MASATSIESAEATIVPMSITTEKSTIAGSHITTSSEASYPTYLLTKITEQPMILNSFQPPGGATQTDQSQTTIYSINQFKTKVYSMKQFIQLPGHA